MEAFKVKLHHVASNTTVIFDASPDITETGAVSYRTIEPIHSPGGISVFTHTSSRTFTISGIKLFSRTQSEATRNFHKFQTIRSWRYPTFGKVDPSQPGQQLGQPPAVLELSAYSLPSSTGSISSANGLLYRIPVVITNLTLNYPTDCDYIPTVHLPEPGLDHIPTGIPFPTLMPIDISLMETHTPKQYEQFSLSDLRHGRMVGF